MWATPWPAALARNGTSHPAAVLCVTFPTTKIKLPAHSHFVNCNSMYISISLYHELQERCRHFPIIVIAPNSFPFFLQSGYLFTSSYLRSASNSNFTKTTYNQNFMIKPSDWIKESISHFMDSKQGVSVLLLNVGIICKYKLC